MTPEIHRSGTHLETKRSEAFKRPAKGQCLNCMDEQEYDLTVPVNRREVLKRIDKVVAERGKCDKA